MLFTKNEGLALWGIALACYFFHPAGLARSSFRWRQLLVLVSISLVALLPWFLYQSHLPRLEEDFFRLLTPLNLVAGVDRLPYLLESFLKEFLLRPHLWSLLGPGLVLSSACAEAGSSQTSRCPSVDRLPLLRFCFDDLSCHSVEDGGVGACFADSASDATLTIVGFLDAVSGRVSWTRSRFLESG